MQCPLCKSRDTGKIGSNQYYCWQCLMEFKASSQQTGKMYFVEEDGSLVPVSFKEEA
ncbi:MAG: hypothetical protein WBK48_04690 [Dethiobacteria bacterium]|nr:hypothetical protein [Bacillota bacterium]HOP68709.1 hypothetical protein [Bacillota bacterium]HPT33761.1 hypothetical protein [Bacillota bacterium]HPZ64405.1 hypothetical protein [Bacillota bacterium]HQD06759.1 hypothetical protein [Bacillota bacterium]